MLKGGFGNLMDSAYWDVTFDSCPLTCKKLTKKMCSCRGRRPVSGSLGRYLVLAEPAQIFSCTIHLHFQRSMVSCNQHTPAPKVIIQPSKTRNSPSLKHGTHWHLIYKRRTSLHLCALVCTAFDNLVVTTLFTRGPHHTVILGEIQSLRNREPLITSC